MNSLPGAFRYFASFFTDLAIESGSSSLNPQLDVVLSSGRYKLNTADATYSFEDRYSSFGTALNAISKEIPKFHTALVLGLGLGSIPLMLISKHQFDGKIDCIEIDPEVIRLAKKYFKIQPLPPQLNFIQADAATFVKKDPVKYDLITVDLFLNTDIPKQFHTKEFLSELKTKVLPGGILLFSRLKENFGKEKQLNHALDRIFTDANEIDAGGNLILCWQAPES